MSVSEKNVKRKLTDIIRSTGNGAVIAISTCFLLFVYAPTELFLTNQSSFWFTLYTMLPAVLGTFAVTVLASVLLLFFCNLISHTLYQIASAGFALLMICSYIQGTFLIFGLPGLDGLAIDWNQYQASRYKSIGLWIIMLIVFIVLIRIFHLRKFLKVAGIVSFCMALMLLVTLFTLSLSSRDSLNKDVLTATTENMFEMSKDTNFIILLLDAVDAPTLNQMIADGKMEGLEDTFGELGIEIVAVTDANFSAETQVSNIETVMAKKPDILVSIPTDATATADAYKQAAAAGIKIVFMDQRADGLEAGKIRMEKEDLKQSTQVLQTHMAM